MLKKILLTCLLLNTATMGLHIGHAEELSSPPVQVKDSNTTVLNEESNFEQNTTDNEKSNVEIEFPEVNQDQSTDSYVNQNQDVTGESVVEQDQTGDHDSCQDQTVEGAPGCHDAIESDVDGQIGQGQTTNLSLGQYQTAESSAGVSAEQELGGRIISEQIQEILFGNGYIDTISQGTDALSNQYQSVETSNAANIEFGQVTDIMVSQLQELDTTGEKEDEQEQLTRIEASQAQKVETSGSASMGQEQTAIVDGFFVNTLKEIVDIGVIVTTKNYVEVIQDTTKNVVKFFQEIFVNDQLLDRSERETALDLKDVHGSVQSVEKEYSWGTLVVKNIAFLFLDEPTENYTTLLGSSLSLVFGAERFGTPAPKPEDEVTPPDNGNGEDPVTPPTEEEETPETDNGGTPIPPTKEEEVPAPASAPTPVTPSVTVVSAKPIKVEVAPVKTAKVENELPNTATNHYNVLLFGLLLVAGGTAVFLQRKRRV
jgi:LPXTG-motif cell wall-anchored protein